MSAKHQSPKKVAKLAFWCESCGTTSMSQQRMLVHLEEVHGCNVKEPFKIVRSPEKQMVGEGFVQRIWKVRAGPAQLICSEIIPTEEKK